MRAINIQNQVLGNLLISYGRLNPIIRRTHQVQPSLSDLESLVLEVAATKSKTAFKKLYDFYYPKSINYMMKAGSSKEIAAELSQEAMLKLWKNASYYSSEKANVNTWFFTLLRNIKYDYLREHNRDPLAVVSAEDVFDDELYLNSYDESDMEQIYHRAQTQEMISQLSIEQQQVLYGVYREGLTQTEYAKLQDIPLGTVKSRIRLAIKNLKLLLEEK